MKDIHIIRDKKTNFTNYMQFLHNVQILHNCPKSHTIISLY
jgi:hypothetical protein